jgi:GrpB-like predicted nucleotidyltransferase (UPF0157 family)
VVLEEPVEFSPHDAVWPDIAGAECRRLAAQAGVRFGDLQHIGSTAVPDSLAKPIIDLMLGVESFPPSHALVGGLEALDYESLGEAGAPGRLSSVSDRKGCCHP